jgi:hypothetical protein
MTALVRRRRWAVLFAASVSLAGCGGRERAEEAVRVAADGFLADLRDGRWNAAYSRLQVDRQAECASAARLGELVVAAGEQPLSWQLRDPLVRKRTAMITGEVTTAGGDGRGIVELAFDRVGAGWRITAWSASNRELCREAG